MSYFSENLRYLREKEGISKSDLSKKINVNQSTLTRWENEEMGATIDNALDVANYFNVSMADLVGKDLRTLKEIDYFKLFLLNNYDLLTNDDKEYIKFIIEKRIKELEK